MLALREFSFIITICMIPFIMNTVAVLNAMGVTPILTLPNSLKSSLRPEKLRPFNPWVNLSYIVRRAGGIFRNI